MILDKIRSRTVRDLLKVLSGNVVAQGIGFATIIIVSRDLGPLEYGVFSLLLAIFTISVQIADFGISTSYVKYASEHLTKIKEIFTTVVVSKVLVSFMVTGALFLLSQKISLFFFDTPAYDQLIEWIAIAIVFHSIFAVLVGHYQAMQDFKTYSMLKIAHSILKLATVCAAALLFSKETHLKLFILSYGYAVGVLILLMLWRYTKYVGRVDIRHFMHIYKLGFWIFLSSIAVMIIMRLDIMMLQKMCGSVEAGYYSVAMNLAMIFPLLTASLVTTLLPKMDRFLKERDIKSYIYKIFSMTKYVVILLILFELSSFFIIEWIFGSEYRESVSVFQILLVAFTFGIIVNPISLVMLSIDKAHLLTLLNWIQLPLNFAGNMVFIPLFQADGAAMSTVILRILGGVYIIVYLLKVRYEHRQ